SQYIRYLEDFRRYYHGKELRFPDGQSLITKEGVGALDDAIKFLRSARPMAPLEFREGMVLGAKDHLNDLVRSGRSGHKGSDGSLPGDRISRYGTWRDSVGENIIYHSNRAREDVISLIIDDGVANRGHRRNIFKPKFHVIGIALSPAVKSGTLGVITFAGGLSPR
ncbi:MAG: CAP domain-containing protein, partial [Acidobacteriota bacterium]|nr:CAP domain-containing protein [Acidobacteriota bacterium]